MSVETIDFLLEKICAPPLGTGTLETCSNSSSRYKNVVLEQPINIDNRIMSSPLLLRDDKREPADVIDEYCLRHNITRDMRNNIITKVCGSGQVVCGREKPVIYRWPFINFTTGEVYGEVEILGGQSVVDVVHLYLLQLDHPMINQTFMEPHVVNLRFLLKLLWQRTRRKEALSVTLSSALRKALCISICVLWC